MYVCEIVDVYVCVCVCVRVMPTTGKLNDRPKVRWISHNYVRNVGEKKQIFHSIVSVLRRNNKLASSFPWRCSRAKWFV